MERGGKRRDVGEERGKGGMPKRRVRRYEKWREIKLR